METYSITLTAAEIEALQICLSGMQITLTNEVNALAEFNENDIYTNLMKLKVERIKDCDALWQKLNSVLPAY